MLSEGVVITCEDFKYTSRYVGGIVSTVNRPAQVKVYQMDLRLQRHMVESHIVEEDSDMVSRDESLEIVDVRYDQCRFGDLKHRPCGLAASRRAHNNWRRS